MRKIAEETKKDGTKAGLWNVYWVWKFGTDMGDSKTEEIKDARASRRKWVAVKTRPFLE